MFRSPAASNEGLAVDGWTGVLVSGVLIAIPISIFANLLTTPIQNWLDKRIKKSSQNREVRRQATFAAQAADLATDRTEYMNYLFEAVLRTTYIGALFAVLTGVIFAVANSFYTPFLDSIQGLGSLVTVVGQLVALIGSFLVISIARDALQMIVAVRRHRQSQQAQVVLPDTEEQDGRRKRWKKNRQKDGPKPSIRQTPEP
jgi:hypothetical protein